MFQFFDYVLDFYGKYWRGKVAVMFRRTFSEGLHKIMSQKLLNGKGSRIVVRLAEDFVFLKHMLS